MRTQKAQTIAAQHQFKVEVMKFIIKHDIKTGRASVFEVSPPFPDGFDIFDTREEAQVVADNVFEYVNRFPDPFARLSNGN
jgi:hypothetical protein